MENERSRGSLQAYRSTAFRSFHPLAATLQSGAGASVMRLVGTMCSGSAAAVSMFMIGRAAHKAGYLLDQKHKCRLGM